MKAKVRKPTTISANAIKRDTENYPTFSFRCLTSDDGYNANAFNGNLRDKCDLYDALMDLMQRCSAQTWMVWFASRHDSQCGIESLPKEQINQRVLNKSATYAFDKVLSVRFGAGQSYRLLGFKIDGDNTFYVLGFDLRFNAYSH